MGKRQGHLSRTQFSLDKMVVALAGILETNVPKISKPVPIVLPSLANIKKPEVEYLEEVK